VRGQWSRSMGISLVPYLNCAHASLAVYTHARVQSECNDVVAAEVLAHACARRSLKHIDWLREGFVVCNRSRSESTSEEVERIAVRHEP
jgi:hypothetical protein